MNSFVLKGNIAYSLDKDHIDAVERGYVICKDGLCMGVFQQIPEEYSSLPLYDYSSQLIVPGMTDLHVHAPQYPFRGVGMDLELLDWLNQYTFPEESKYADLDYAKESHQYFVNDLVRSFTTRACIFATIHKDATITLMDQLEQTGLVTYVGKINMDRNAIESLQEKDASTSLSETRNWLSQIEGRYHNTFPILTPRFIPTCSDELMSGLGNLSAENNLRIQSHLSENLSEIDWVKSLVPKASCYGGAYELFETLGSPSQPAIMAHCVYSTEEEQQLLLDHGTYVAHCADSNLNLSSGIAPIRKYIDKGIPVGLGTDVAAGSSMNMLATMLATIQASKMYWRLVDTKIAPLSFAEVFYLATEGGGSYFGSVGSFKKGYEFDALVIDDGQMVSTLDLDTRTRVERMIYNDSDCVILEKYVRGKKVFSRT